MTKLKRNYLQRTIKLLFGLSGNECAFPGCTSPIIAKETPESDALVSGQICHIFAVMERGPRGKSGLTERELNAPENLILLCPTHHGLVDGQHETYPAETLKDWKQKHEAKHKRPISPDSGSASSKGITHARYPEKLVAQKIEHELSILRKARFSSEFDQIEFSLLFAKRLIDGDLSGGIDVIRCRALAWCARLSRNEKSGRAEEILEFARTIGKCPEIEIARAFLYSSKGEEQTALTALAGIDLPMARSAALQIKAHHHSPQEAVDWLKKAGLSASDLDPDGKFVLLLFQFELNHSKVTHEWVAALSDQDFEEAPMLHYLVAMAHLLPSVPIELRPTTMNEVPFEAVNFPLFSDTAAIETRRTARQHFVKCAEMLRDLIPNVGWVTQDEYALWLELRDPDDSAHGRKRLERMLCNTDPALRLVRLGLQFGIKLNLEAINREIDRQIALNGGMTTDTALARFALAFTKKTPQDVANYIAHYREDLFEHLDKGSIISLEIEMLSRSGLPDRARERLAVLIEDGTSEAQEHRLRRIIAEADGTNPIEARKRQFKKTDRLFDLASLVNELEARGEYSDLCEYGAELFERTRFLLDAERLARALSSTQSHEKLIAFLKTYSDLLDQSKNLRFLFCWSLYHEGALLDARRELAKLDENRDEPNHRILQINLGIALGDWASLLEFVARECREKDKRSASELIGAAQIAFPLGSPFAEELLFAAASTGAEDANVLATAYFLATSADLEDKAEVFQWFQNAVELSGNDGPIRAMPPKDVIKQKPDWDRQRSDAVQQLRRGEFPMFLAAQQLNKSLIDLIVFPALANISENDPRRREAVPAYCGVRQPKAIIVGGTVGIGATTLLTLSMLDLLDDAFAAFGKLFIPHSTLAWLFEEKQKVAFHQPSRIRDAHQLRDLLATGDLVELSPSTVPDSDLSVEVGEELASMISEAKRAADDDNPQRVVIRPAPVYRVESIMEEEADLRAHASVMSGCQPVVDKLRQKGQITVEEEKRAGTYLQLQEKPWPAQPEIADGAELYLSDLAIVYFLHLGILGKLKAAGLRPVVHPRVASEANHFIAYERISNQVDEIIEKIRKKVNSEIELGKVAIGKSARSDESKGNPIEGHPTSGVLALAPHCDAVFVDDRFVNQHANIDHGDGSTAIVTTIDLIDQFATDGLITFEKWLESRTFLRRAGYFFVPVSNEELKHHLKAAAVVRGKLSETAELKAIRENTLQVRMSSWLQLPKEVFWFDSLFRVFFQVLKDQWTTGADISEARVRSDWLLDQVDVRGWAHCFGDEDGGNIAKIGRGQQILLLLFVDGNASPGLNNEYWTWIEEKVLVPIKEQDPDLYTWILARTREQIEKMADLDLPEGDQE